MYVASFSTTEPNEISSDLHNRRTSETKGTKAGAKILKKKTLSQKQKDQKY